jgi:tRNA U34 5-methylaminomethyl-2-thiouridine-forming methyltransferase MnmC
MYRPGLRRCSARLEVINTRNKRNCINIVKQENSPKKEYGNGFLLDHVDNEEY